MPKRYELTSAAIPKLSEGGAGVIYKRLEPYGNCHSLEDVIEEVEKRHFSVHFKRHDSRTVPGSVRLQLRHSASLDNFTIPPINSPFRGYSNARI